jgi:regulator of sigma E protease
MDYLPAVPHYLTTPVAFVVVLGILIFVHEFGHFIVARRLGVGVTKFSFGFGPKLFGVTRGGTDYLVSAIPLGGYVKLVGESDGDEVPDSLRARSFSHKPIRVKMAVVAAGLVGNLLAVPVFWIVFLGGVPSLTPKIGNVLPESPAARAGLKGGDVVVRIDGETVSTWEELAGRIRREGTGREISLTVRRDGKEFTVPVAPEIREGRSIFGEKVQEPKIGIVAGQEIVRKKLGPVSALLRAGKETGKLVELTVMTVVKLVTRVLPSDTLGGPILIAQLAGDQARLGVSPFAYFLGLERTSHS